jgi:hypothetical protein
LVSNTPQFYVFQGVPEYVVAASFAFLDIRKLWGGKGKWGKDLSREEDDTDGRMDASNTELVPSANKSKTAADV